MDDTNAADDDVRWVTANPSLFEELRTLRLIRLWVDVAGNATGGSVEWYEASEHVETVVCGAGPFEQAEELLHRLLELRRLP